ncbi:MAG TPA: FtsQ-type POTRA domain-containing protein [Propionibacteriaceae bacterium]
MSGTKELTPEQVRAAAQVRLGQPLARQNLQAIAERAGQLPQLAEVRVTRDWPSAVGITVVERKPLLAVAQPSGFVLVDKTGVAYESRSAVPGGVFLADVNPDDRALLTEAGVVATALTGSLGKQVDRVAATNSDNITVRLDSGVVVTWGDSTNSALKAQLTTALLKQKPRTSIDVSSPHNPAIR